MLVEEKSSSISVCANPFEAIRLNHVNCQTELPEGQFCPFQP